MRLSPFLFLMACAAGTSGASPPERVANGAWGGEHVRLIVHDDGGTIEFDCAHGTLDKPLTLDPSGRFEVPGSLVAEGGPTLRDEVRTGRRARFRGTTDGQHLSLEVTFEGGESAGTFTLARNGRAKLVKCR